MGSGGWLWKKRKVHMFFQLGSNLYITQKRSPVDWSERVASINILNTMVINAVIKKILLVLLFMTLATILCIWGSHDFRYTVKYRYLDTPIKIGKCYIDPAVT